MKIVHASFGLVVGLTLVVGCSSVNYAQNGAVAPRAPREPSLIVIHMHGDAPPKGFQVAGTLHASAGNAARSLELIREEAAKNGLDGVADVVCAPAGARDEGSCDGQGFVYQ
ncbi:MAG: hypothetical protein JWM74_5227 [Myxococcaceae bacterium]|jgi:hypothetical protein|nr:hypothetical protein [Myxococcaceae bacterium]